MCLHLPSGGARGGRWILLSTPLRHEPKKVGCSGFDCWTLSVEITEALSDSGDRNSSEARLMCLVRMFKF
jgi:hypothetical protein